jgi:hypothetical protein
MFRYRESAALQQLFRTEKGPGGLLGAIYEEAAPC